MGTYADIYGEIDIPCEQMPELTERMLTVMRLGGMMNFDFHHLFGAELALLKPPALDKDKNRIFSDYCYFDRLGFWEPAGFDANDCRVFSCKIGTAAFNGVVMAMYTLFVLYSRKPCLALLDGRFFDTTPAIGWLNYILGTQYASGLSAFPVEPVNSEEYLRVPGDERAYWWREGGDVEFSPEMRRWLGELRREYFEIAAYPGPTPANYAKILIETLARASTELDVFFFASVFEEFIAHSEHRDAQAAIVLLTRLFDGYAPGGELFSRPGYVWDTGWSRHNDNFGAYALKLYFAVLGNPELRRKVFKF